MIVGKVLFAVIFFILGFHFGKTSQATSDVNVVIREQKTNKVLRQEINKKNYEIYLLKCNRVDGCELIAWIENYQHNYEWVSPPTSGEIVGQIRRMMGAQE